jgi:hypothetical protein
LKEFSYALVIGVVLPLGGHFPGPPGETRFQQMDSRPAQQIGGIARHQWVEFFRQNLRDAGFALNHPIPGAQLPVGFPTKRCQARVKPGRSAFGLIAMPSLIAS